MCAWQAKHEVSPALNAVQWLVEHSCKYNNFYCELFCSPNILRYVSYCCEVLKVVFSLFHVHTWSFTHAQSFAVIMFEDQGWLVFESTGFLILWPILSSFLTQVSILEGCTFWDDHWPWLLPTSDHRVPVLV